MMLKSNYNYIKTMWCIQQLSRRCSKIFKLSFEGAEKVVPKQYQKSKKIDNTHNNALIITKEKKSNYNSCALNKIKKHL